MRAKYNGAAKPPRHHVKQVFPFFSDSPEFWKTQLDLVSQDQKIVQLEHSAEGKKLLLVLFPCVSEEREEAPVIGAVALELRPPNEVGATNLQPLSPTARMIAIVGHELRNPLSAIGAGLRIVEMSSSDASVEKVLNMMKRQLALASRLVNDLLDSTSVTTKDGLPLVLKEELLSDVINITLDGFQYRASAKKHTLYVNVPEQPLKVRCDLGRLSQAITNLLHNSSKYTPSGGHIALDVVCCEGEITITVTDDGVGIPEEKLETIFKAFTQVDASSPKGAGGVGLGLFLVKAIVEGHGGKVSASSAGKNLGSTFAISIPSSSQ
jgi:signal transduction histidine kinase